MLSEAGVTTVPGLPAGLTGLSADSRAIEPGMLYAALPGARLDGRDFIAEAVARGAVAVLAPEGTAWPDGVPAVPLLTDREPRRALARLAALQAGAQPATVIAVTGTNGKTSTVEFIRQLKSASGGTAASLGTLGVIAPGRAGGGGLTTPDPVSLAQTLAELAREGGRDCGHRGVVARAGPVPAGWAAAGGGGLQQSHTRSFGLPRHAGGLSRGQAAAIPRVAAAWGRRWW